MPDNDIFKEDGTETKTDVSLSSNPDPFNDKLAMIKNDQGEQKYRDVGTALDALNASQAFIETLKTEKAEMARELEELRVLKEQKQNIDDLILRVNPDNPTDTTKMTDQNRGMSEEQIARLLEQTIASREAKVAQDKNLGDVVAQLSQIYGDKAAEQIKKRAAELGTTTDSLRDIAKTNPRMALELLVGKPTKPAVNPSQSQIFPPHQVPDDNPRPSWERSAARGGLSNKELALRWGAVRDYTNKKLGVES